MEFRNTANSLTLNAAFKAPAVAVISVVVTVVG